MTCTHVGIAPNVARLCCRRLSPEQSEASAQALKSIAPDDDFVIAMIRHWWHPAAAAAARKADQRNSTQGQLPAPLHAAEAAQAHGQQPFEALTAGNPQAAAIDKITERLLTQREHPQQGSQQSPITTNLYPKQTEGTLQQRPQGSDQEQAFAGLKGSSHAASGDNVQHQGPPARSVDQSSHPLRLTGAEAAEAVPQPRTEPPVETVNTGEPCRAVICHFLWLYCCSSCSSVIHQCLISSPCHAPCWRRQCLLLRLVLRRDCHTTTGNSYCTAAVLFLSLCKSSKVKCVIV